MFISQNTLMGRVNILYSLMSREIHTTHRVGTWILNMISKSRTDRGEISFSLYALWTMFANKGLVSFSNLIKAGINVSSPSKQTYKSLLEGLSSDYLLSVVVK